MRLVHIYCGGSRACGPGAQMRLCALRAEPAEHRASGVRKGLGAEVRPADGTEARPEDKSAATVATVDALG